MYNYPTTQVHMQIMIEPMTGPDETRMDCPRVVTTVEELTVMEVKF